MDPTLQSTLAVRVRAITLFLQAAAEESKEKKEDDAKFSLSPVFSRIQRSLEKANVAPSSDLALKILGLWLANQQVWRSPSHFAFLFIGLKMAETMIPLHVTRPSSLGIHVFVTELVFALVPEVLDLEDEVVWALLAAVIGDHELVKEDQNVCVKNDMFTVKKE